MGVPGVPCWQPRRARSLPRRGCGYGVLLWLLMGLVFLPALGWGFFGTAITAAIAVATLVLHLVYGGTLGWTLDRGIVSGSSLSKPTADQQSG